MRLLYQPFLISEHSLLDSDGKCGSISVGETGPIIPVAQLLVTNPTSVSLSTVKPSTHVGSGRTIHVATQLFLLLLGSLVLEYAPNHRSPHVVTSSNCPSSVSEIQRRSEMSQIIMSPHPDSERKTSTQWTERTFSTKLMLCCCFCFR